MKNIVICCDGTGNEYGRNNTNVVETYALVEKDRDQVAGYDPDERRRDFEPCPWDEPGAWACHRETLRCGGRAGARC